MILYHNFVITISRYHFICVFRYLCLLVGKTLRGTSSKEVCKMILSRNPSYNDQYQLGLTKVS